MRPAPAVTTAVGVGTEPVTLDDRVSKCVCVLSHMTAVEPWGLSTYVPLPPDGGGTPNPVEGAGATPVGPQGTATVS